MPAEIRVPSVGESVSEAVIAEWVLSEGDSVQRDQPVVVLETDKANMELPSPAAGRLSQILKKPGDTVRVGDVIGYIEEGEQGNAPAARQEAPREEAPRQEAAPRTASAPEPAKREAAPVVTPAARRLLADRGLKPQEVSASGRIGKEDVQRHLETKKPEPTPPAPRPAPPPPKGQAQTDAHGRQEEVVPMSLLRKRVAKRLVEAQQSAALLTTFNEVDMTATMEVRKRYQEEFTKEHGVKLGFMSFFVKAAVEGLKAFPELNAYIQDDTIVYHDYYDIGVAVSAPKGLVVPVLRNAERLSFAEVEKAIGDFGERARNNRLAVDDLQGGTFTISNGGVFGSMMSTPIVNPPQSGILGMHKIMERPVAVGGQVVVRPMMYLALTYDHRIVDGREAVSFLVRVKECIENPVRLLLEI